MGKRVDTLFQTAAAAFFMFLIGGVPAIAQQEAPSEAQATPESQGPTFTDTVEVLSLIHISEPTRPRLVSRMPSSA